MNGLIEIPPYIRPHEVGKACEMRTEAARRMLRRAGILEKLGGACVVPESRLRERLPDVYDRVYAWHAHRQAQKSKAKQGNAQQST